MLRLTKITTVLIFVEKRAWLPHWCAQLVPGLLAGRHQHALNEVHGPGAISYVNRAQAHQGHYCFTCRKTGQRALNEAPGAGAISYIKRWLSEPLFYMVLILYGNLEIGANIKIFCYLIWIRHLSRLRAVTNRISFLRKDLFFFMHAQHILIDILYDYHAIFILSLSDQTKDLRTCLLINFPLYVYKPKRSYNIVKSVHSLLFVQEVLTLLI